MRTRRHRAIERSLKQQKSKNWFEDGPHLHLEISKNDKSHVTDDGEMLVPLQTKKERQERAAKAIEDLRKVVENFGRRFGRKK